MHIELVKQQRFQESDGLDKCLVSYCQKVDRKDRILVA